MTKLKNVLSDSSRARRHRRNNLNIQITFLSWLTEVFGFFVIFMGSFLVGHQNIVITQIFQTITLLFYLAIVPSVYLLNGSDIKDSIADSSIYRSFNQMFTSKSSQIEQRLENLEGDHENDSKDKDEELNDQCHDENINSVQFDKEYETPSRNSK